MSEDDTVGEPGLFRSSARDGNGTPARACGALDGTGGKATTGGVRGPETGGSCWVGGVAVTTLDDVAGPATIGFPCSSPDFAVCWQADSNKGKHNAATRIINGRVRKKSGRKTE